MGEAETWPISVHGDFMLILQEFGPGGGPTFMPRSFTREDVQLPAAEGVEDIRTIWIRNQMIRYDLEDEADLLYHFALKFAASISGPECEPSEWTLIARGQLSPSKYDGGWKDCLHWPFPVSPHPLPKPKSVASRFFL